MHRISEDARTTQTIQDKKAKKFLSPAGDSLGMPRDPMAGRRESVVSPS
jgi:hypothetical protein